MLRGRLYPTATEAPESEYAGKQSVVPPNSLLGSTVFSKEEFGAR